MTSSLPTLGPRGEGWVAIQVVILAVIFLAGWLGPAWGGVLHDVTAVVGAVLIGIGALLAVRGLLDLRENLTALPHPRPGGRLIQHGAYRLVRHPIYGGLILGGIGWGLVTASPLALLGAAGLLGFFDLKSRREEAWLVVTYPGYRRYRDRTRRLIPFLY